MTEGTASGAMFAAAKLILSLVTTPELSVTSSFTT